MSSSMEQKLIDSCATRPLGMKWYFFFVKIRPWFEIIITFCWLITSLIKLVPYAIESLNKVAICTVLFSLIYGYIRMVLQLRVFIASITALDKLEKYIENLLRFEVFILACRWAKVARGLAGVVLWFVVILLGYYVWYRPNMTYFGKRLIMAYIKFPTQSVQNKETGQVIQGASANGVSELKADLIHNSAVLLGKVSDSVIDELHECKPYSEQLIHKTLKGDYVRSKSEVIIANMLYDAGIQYEYEKELDLGQDGIKIPDFTIEVPRKGRIFFWEHCGMMTNLKYQHKWNIKKSIYEKHNIIEGQNLIVSQDLPNGGIDSVEIKRLIDIYLR